MTAINFPTSPNTGDEFTAAGRTWIYDGTTWNSKPYADVLTATITAALVDSAPETLDTLNELAAALGDDADFATTVTNSLSNKSDTDHTHLLADITDVTATATELNYVDGVTSSIQTQLDAALGSVNPTFTLSGDTFVFVDDYAATEVFFTPESSLSREILVSTGESGGTGGRVTEVLGRDASGGTYFEITLPDDRKKLAYRAAGSSKVQGIFMPGQSPTNSIVASGDRNGAYASSGAGTATTPFPDKFLVVNPANDTELRLFVNGSSTATYTSPVAFSDIIWYFTTWFGAISTTGVLYFSNDEGATWTQGDSTGISNAKISYVGEGGFQYLVQIANADFSQVKVGMIDPFTYSVYYTNTRVFYPLLDFNGFGYFGGLWKFDGSFYGTGGGDSGPIGGIASTENVVAGLAKSIDEFGIRKVYIFIYDSVNNATTIKSIITDTTSGFLSMEARKNALVEGVIPGRYTGVSSFNRDFTFEEIV